MKELGLTDVEELETVPYHDLALAYNKVAPEVGKTGHYTGGNPMANDWYLGDPMVVGFTEHAKTIPVMVGTVLGEFAFMPALTKEEKADAALVDKKIHDRYGKDADELIKLFKAAYPKKDISDLIYLDHIFRNPSSKFVCEKAKYPQSGTYSYLFTYTFPYDDGHIAWHCSEIPFVFHNTNLVAAFNEEGVTDKLEKQMADAWLNFARTGKPSSEDLPAWPACTDGDEAVMIFDKECEVVHNHDHELVPLVKKAAPPFIFGEAKIEH